MFEYFLKEILHNHLTNMYRKLYNSSFTKSINNESIDLARKNMDNVVYKTSLEFNERLSNIYNCNIYFKREDQQKVRSFKIRGAFNKIYNLSDENKSNGVVCASAGNHAQGFGYSCKKLGIKGDIFIPEKTPIQKVNRIKKFSNGSCNIHMFGNSFDECLKESLNFTKNFRKHFIHPYDDIDTIIGQGTIAKEIYEEITPDIIIGSIGGGGLMSGVGIYSKNLSDCIVLGAEPESCPSMKISIKEKKIIDLKVHDYFVDGATVSKVGNLTFKICQDVIDDIYKAPIGKICGDMLDLYQNEGIVLEPAGILPVSILDQVNNKEGKNIVCILSGGNNDITRYPEITERYLRYQKLKHYYIIEFTQTPGQLKKFINNILGPNDDITRFEYIKKTNRNMGNVLIGIQLINSDDIHNIENKLSENKFNFIRINENDLLYSYLI